MSECQWFVNHSQEMFYSFPVFWLMEKQDIVRGGQSHAAPGRRVSAACPHYKDGGSDRQIVPPTCFLCSSSFHSLTHFLPSWLPASSPRNRLTFRGMCTWSFAQWRFSPSPPALVSLGTSTHIFSFLLLTYRKGKDGGASGGETQFGRNPEREWVPQTSSVPDSWPLGS